VRDLGVEPSAAVVQRGGKVPVVERGHGLDPLGEELVHEAIVEDGGSPHSITLTPSAMKVRAFAARCRIGLIAW
jgi:hypothetical protein